MFSENLTSELMKEIYNILVCSLLCLSNRTGQAQEGRVEVVETKIGSGSNVLKKKFIDGNLEQIILLDSVSGQLIFSTILSESNPYEEILHKSKIRSLYDHVFDLSNDDKVQEIIDALKWNQQLNYKALNRAYCTSRGEVYTNSFSIIYTVELSDINHNIQAVFSTVTLYSENGEIIYHIKDNTEKIVGLIVPQNNRYIGISYGDIYGEGIEGVVPPPGLRIIDTLKGRTLYENNSPKLREGFTIGDVFVITENTADFGDRYIIINPGRGYRFEYSLSRQEVNGGVRFRDNCMQLVESDIILYYEKDFDIYPLD